MLVAPSCTARDLTCLHSCADQSYGHDQTYGNNSGYDPAANGLDQSSGQDQYTSNAHQQPYNDASQQQQYQVDEGYGGEQQGNYSDSTGMNNSNASGGAAGNRGGGQLDTYSTPQDYQDSGPNMQGAQGSQGRQGTQASGQGFGQGFDQGFDQGLAGGPGGSQPHSGVEITEQSGPGYESRDADLVSTCDLQQAVSPAVRCTVYAACLHAHCNAHLHRVVFPP